MKSLIMVLMVCLLAVPAVVAASAQTASEQTDVAANQLNINLASVKELQKLPGLGKVTAEKIVAYREANGPFSTVEDLLKVNGVGKKTLAKFRDKVSVQ